MVRYRQGGSRPHCNMPDFRAWNVATVLRRRGNHPSYLIAAQHLGLVPRPCPAAQLGYTEVSVFSGSARLPQGLLKPCGVATIYT